MVGIIVVSHGYMAQESVKSAHMLVGECESLAYEGIQPGEPPEVFFERVKAIADQVDDGSGIVALVDLFGGTPNNTVYRLKREKNVRIIAGFNLPMLIHAITERMPETTQAELVEELLSVGASEIREFGC